MIVLVTGSREWTDEPAVEAALKPYAREGNTLFHGAATGLDTMAERVWTRLCLLAGVHPRWRRFPARDYPTPRVRNQTMVDYCDPSDTVCYAFAKDWASGTGMCARMARRAGISTYDIGVKTE